MQYPIIVGKGFNKYAIAGISRMTGDKCLCISRDDMHVEVCICFADDDSIRHMINALEKLLDLED